MKKIKILLLFTLLWSSGMVLVSGSDVTAGNQGFLPQIFLISPENNTITSKTQVLFKGTAPGALSLKVNGANVPMDSNGKFFYKGELATPNAYTLFVMTAFSADNQEASLIRKVFYKSKDVLISSVSKALVKPALEVLLPQNNFFSYNGKVLFKGIVKNAKELRLDGKKIKIDKDGRFFEKIALKKRNSYKKFTLVASNGAGHDVVTERRVFYSAPKSMPVIEVVSPEPNHFAHKGKVLFKGSTENTERLTLNGQEVAMDIEGKFFLKKNLTKRDTYNNFELVAYSDDGSQAKESRKVFFPTEKTAKGPELLILSPKNNFFSYNGKVLVKGRAYNVKTLMINGSPVTLTEDGKFYKKLTLKEMATYSMINFRAVGIKGETVTTNRRVYYAEKKQTPVGDAGKAKFEVLLPKQNFFSYKKEVLFKGIATNVKKMTLNGAAVPVDIRGKFYLKIDLDRPNEYHNYELKAYTDSGEVLTETRKVFFQSEASGARVAKEMPETVSEKAPFLKLVTPANNFISRKNLVLFKGSTDPDAKLRINGRIIEIDKAGKFFYKADLTTPERYHHFKVTSSKNRVYSVENVKVYFRPLPGMAAKKAPSKVNDNLLYSPELVQERSTQEHIGSKTSSKIPKIELDYPENNFVTYKDHITLKGSVENTEEMYINSKLVKVDANGRFSVPFPLDSTGKFIFNLYALGQNDLNKTVIRKVFRVSQAMKKSPVLSEKGMDAKLSKQISLELADADIKDVMKILAKKGSINIISDESLTGLVNVSLKDVALLTAIDLILNSQGIAYKLLENTLVIGESSNLTSATRMKTSIVHLNNLKAKNLESVIGPQLSSNESVQILEQDNLIIINADSRKITSLIEMVRKLDEQKVPQIFLEAQIVEISKTALDSMGIAWGASYGLGVNMSFAQSSEPSITSALSLSTIINLLESDGKAKILAKPRITAVNKVAAEIFIGDKVPYVEFTSDPSGRVVEAVKFVDAGITLKVLPFINPRNREIRMDLAPEVSYINGFKGKNNDIPIVRKRRVTTTVWVKDGETVIIGGLFNSSDSDSSSKVPFLGDLPLVGNLFTANKTEKEETELIITVTPRIIESIADPVEVQVDLQPKKKL